MRFFGIFAAFTAVTTVFAAPLAAPAPASADALAVRANNVVPANIASIVTDLQGDVNGVINDILTAIHNANDEVTAVIPVIEPLLAKLGSDIAAAAGKVGLNALGSLFNFGGGSNGGMNINDFVALMTQLDTDLINVLLKVAQLIKQDYPDVANQIQTVVTMLSMLSGAIQSIVHNSQLNLNTPLTEIIKPLLALLGINIPGFKA